MISRVTAPATLPDGRRPRSLTHVHLARVLEAEAPRSLGRPLRVLDAGCGNGYLIDYVQSFLTALDPPVEVELHGFDVSDPGVQTVGYFEQAVSELSECHPEVDWASRLHLIRNADAWPFTDEHFDFVISNQVLEHILDLDHFLSQIRRVLRQNGSSVNLFPVRDAVIEGHVGVPFAHRVFSHDLRASYLESVARLGLDGLGPLVRQSKMTAASYGESTSDYISFMTAYRSWREIAQHAQALGFRAGYRYTQELYWTKIWSLFGRDFRGGYDSTRRPLADTMFFHTLKMISGVTIVLKKYNTYRAEDFPAPARIDAEGQLEA